MAKKIVVNIAPEEVRMALLEDDELQEVLFERTLKGHIVGNIYKGRIKSVLPGMQAAFVDIGRDKNAFLYIGDNLGKPTRKQLSRGKPLTEGQEIMVQVIKDAIGTKGPRVTTNLTLPGRYVVFMPGVDYIGISRRIDSEEERERLKTIAGQVRPPDTGIIVRTVAEKKNEDDLKKDIEYLNNLWSALAARSKRVNSPTLLYRDVDLVIRIVRDYLASDVEEVILDNKDAYSRVCDLLGVVSPELIPAVRIYQGQGNIFRHFGIEEQIVKLGQRQVWLDCGGYLVIDKTEALTVIDVNTGKFIGTSNLSDTVFRTNLAAVKEIARQIRLRDIGGIIIIDFIDMDTEEHKQAVLKELLEQLKKDRTKTNVIGLTGLGLVELTRKKARQGFDATVYSECPCCDGRGRVMSAETVIINIRRYLRELSEQPRKAGCLVIQAHPRVVAELENTGQLAEIKQELSRELATEAMPLMHPEMFSVLSVGI